MKINIRPIEKPATESEKQIVNVAVLNFAALINALIIGKGMVSNPIEEEENIGLEVFLDSEATEQQKEEFTRKITNQVTMFLQMAGVAYSVEIE